MTRKKQKMQEIALEEYRIKEEPFYLPLKNETALFLAAYRKKLPVMLKGPTGCGKTRFLEYMAYRLDKPLITVACHEDLTASDLVGRYLLEGEETKWHDGPLTAAVKNGGILYLEEIPEARKDTTVLIHPLTDDRRILPIEKKSQIIEAPDEFMLVISYNPGYQSIIKNLKQSTRQRFIGITFDYPPEEKESEIVAHEGGVSRDIARSLVNIGRKARAAEIYGLEENVGTRQLIYAARLIKGGVSFQKACEVSIVKSISDDADIQKKISDILAGEGAASMNGHER
jgi:nitric oxide reductase NorQ protein